MNKDLRDQLEQVIGSMRHDAEILNTLSMQYLHHENLLTHARVELKLLASDIEQQLLPPMETK